MIPFTFYNALLVVAFTWTGGWSIFVFLNDEGLP